MALPRGAGALVRAIETALATSARAPQDRATLRTEVVREDARARVYLVVRAPLDAIEGAVRAILRGVERR